MTKRYSTSMSLSTLVARSRGPKAHPRNRTLISLLRSPKQMVVMMFAALVSATLLIVALGLAEGLVKNSKGTDMVAKAVEFAVNPVTGPVSGVTAWPFGGARALNYVSLSESDLDRTGKQTYSGWFKIDTGVPVGTEHTIYSVAGPDSTGAGAVENALVFNQNSSAGGLLIFTTTGVKGKSMQTKSIQSASLSTGKWYYFTTTIQHNKRMKLFVDGSRVGNIKSPKGTIFDAVNPGFVGIGANVDTGQVDSRTQLTGALADIVYSNTYVSNASQATKLYEDAKAAGEE